jgi:DNA modification methylase
MPDQYIDLIITDPPYNIGDDNKRTKVGNKIMSNMDAWGEWDNYDKKEYDEFIFKILQESFRILKDGSSFYMFTAREDNGFFIRKAIECGFLYKNQLAIIKENPLPRFNKNNYRSAFELCMYLTKGKPKTFNFISQKMCNNVHKYLIGRKDSEHPTEKPLKFFEKVILISSNEGDIVFDPFMGSGTTAIACIRNNRYYIGCEISNEYCKMINKRILDANMRLF